jgi:hypothetical protein
MIGRTKFEYVYHNFDKVLGKIIKNYHLKEGEEWYLILWPDGLSQWLCDSRDFKRDDVSFLEDVEEKKRLELLLRIK